MRLKKADHWCTSADLSNRMAVPWSTSRPTVSQLVRTVNSKPCADAVVRIKPRFRRFSLLFVVLLVSSQPFWWLDLRYLCLEGLKQQLSSFSWYALTMHLFIASLALCKTIILRVFLRPTSLIRRQLGPYGGLYGRHV